MALMAVAAIAFTSCTPKNSNEPTPSIGTYAYAEYTFTANVSESLASVADLRLVYTDENGKQTEKIVSGKSATISVKTTGPVESISIEAYTSKKADADFTETNPYAYKSETSDAMVMDLDMDFSGVLTTVDDKGNSIRNVNIFAPSVSYIGTLLFGVEKIVDMRAEIPFARKSYTIDSKGHIEQ